jgi:hypothetical protein
MRCRMHREGLPGAEQAAVGNNPRRQRPHQWRPYRGANHDEDPILDLGERTRAGVAAG